MHKIICYNSETRQQFDDKTAAVLDLILEHCARVEIEVPTVGLSPEQWFVQVYRVGDENLPEGFYGNTVLEAATRIAKALRIKTGE